MDKLDNIEKLSMMDKISVIVPCYNVSNYIETCLESLVCQTIGIEHLEIILVDDCSTDNTYELLLKYESMYPENIVVASTPENSRQGAARNVGLSLATGKYISFVDSDDWVRRDMYEILYNVLEKTGCDIVQFGFTYVYEFQEDEALNEVSYDIYTFEDDLKHRHFLLSTEIMDESCWKKIYSHKIVKEAQAHYVEKICYEEPMFTYPLKFYVKRFCKMNAPLYYYRYNPEGTIHSYMANTATITDHLSAQLQLYSFMASKPFYSQYKDEIQFKFLFSFLYEPFCFFKMRNKIYPAQSYRFAIEKVEALIPAYKDNKYINNIETFRFLRQLLIDLESDKSLSDNELQAKIVMFQKEIEL